MLIDASYHINSIGLYIVIWTYFVLRSLFTYFSDPFITPQKDSAANWIQNLQENRIRSFIYSRAMDGTRPLLYRGQRKISPNARYLRRCARPLERIRVLEDSRAGAMWVSEARRSRAKRIPEEAARRAPTSCNWFVRR